MKLILRFLGLPLFFVTLSAALNIKLKVYPEPDDPKNNLIWFNASTADIWSQKLDNYVEVYRSPIINQEMSENLISCDHDHPTTDGKACTLNPEKFDPCVVTKYFGYKKLEPCIFIELQSVKGWRPKYYNDTKSLPATMPWTLKDSIDRATQDPNEWRNIWISCEGDTPADKEFIGFVNYYPKPGFPGYFFPYTGQQYYLNPTVAIQFRKIQYGVVLNIECKVWGPGIDQDRKNSNGIINFQLLIDSFMRDMDSPA